VTQLQTGFLAPPQKIHLKLPAVLLPYYWDLPKSARVNVVALNS